MKTTVVTTCMMIVALAALLVLAGGIALAAPNMEMVDPGLMPQHGFEVHEIDPALLGQLQLASPEDGAGDEQDPGEPGEQGADDQEFYPADPAPDPGTVDPDPEQNPVDPDPDPEPDPDPTPVTPDPEPEQPETVGEDAYTNPGTSKPGTNNLPNTGTQLAILAGAALTVVAIAIIARRAASKRVR